jgi:hypothetical protein
MFCVLHKVQLNYGKFEFIFRNFKSLSESIEWKDLKADEKVMILEHIVENSENFMKTKSTWYSNEF